jgi:tRNA (cmo5U34)-methyltransferase
MIKSIDIHESSDELSGEGEAVRPAQSSADEQDGRDTGYVPPRWTFDGEVTRVFDDMLARSIPQIDVMRRACFDLGCRYVRPKSDIVDLGCARGDALDPFVKRFGCHNRFIGVEISQPMMDAARDRFAGYVETGVVEIRSDDLRLVYPPVRASLTLCVLTLQFTPIEHRLRIVRDIFRHTAPGGALILVEKVLGASADLDAAMVDLYYGLKAENGYSRDEIDRKRLALEGVLVPVTLRWNEEMLAGAGFSEIDGFWRWFNFCGWIAVKAL